MDKYSLIWIKLFVSSLTLEHKINDMQQLKNMLFVEHRVDVDQCLPNFCSSRHTMEKQLTAAERF